MPVQSHTVGPCSLSQVVTAETLRGWGEPGLDASPEGVAARVCPASGLHPGRLRTGACCAVLCRAVLCCAICRGGGRSAASCGWQAGSSAAALWHTKHAGWARQLTCTCAPSLLLPSLPAAAPRGPGRVVCALCWHVPLAAPADRARWVGGWVGGCQRPQPGSSGVPAGCSRVLQGSGCACSSLGASYVRGAGALQACSEQPCCPDLPACPFPT